MSRPHLVRAASAMSMVNVQGLPFSPAGRGYFARSQRRRVLGSMPNSSASVLGDICTSFEKGDILKVEAYADLPTVADRRAVSNT